MGKAVPGSARLSRKVETRRTSPLRQLLRCKYLYAMILLPLLYYAVFQYGPMYGLIISLKNYNARMGILGSPWVGLKWFVKFLSDPYFWQVVRNTLILNFLDLLIGFPAPIILAILLNELRSGRFKRAVQSISYLPHFLSTMVICGMMSSFLSRGGLINDLVALLGGTRMNFLASAAHYRTIFILSNVWQTVGWNSIIFLAALSGVNQELYEVAFLDGANRFQQMLYVTLPSIVGTICVMLIMRCGQMMNSSVTKTLLLYNGSTMEVADVVGTYLYRRGLLDNNYSYSTAMGLFNSLINFALLLTVNRISNRLSGDGLW